MLMDILLRVPVKNPNNFECTYSFVNGYETNKRTTKITKVACAVI